MYQATTAEYLFFPPAELRKETLPGLLLGSYNQQEILEQGHSQTCWGEIKANVHGNIKAGGEEKKKSMCFTGTWIKADPVLAFLYEIRPVHSDPFG